ncbi:hypothetical protein L195_g054192, partial [Trifolium pratense]
GESLCQKFLGENRGIYQRVEKNRPKRDSPSTLLPEDFKEEANQILLGSEDNQGIAPHDDDPLVIQVQILNCDVKRVLIDFGSSEDIMYWEAFKAMQLAEEQVDVMGYASLLTTFGDKDNAKTIKVRYLVVKTPFTSYNIIIGRAVFNALGAVVSTLYLEIKYPLDNGGVATVRGDQLLAKRCYESSLKIRHMTSEILAH